MHHVLGAAAVATLFAAVPIRALGSPDAPKPPRDAPTAPVVTELAPQPVLEASGVTVAVGGFVELAGVFRSRSESASVGSNFGNGIPLANQPAAHQSEMRFSAQQSRLAIRVQAKPDEATALTGYVEGDFLGAAATANSDESNSYTPRLRQFFAAYDRADIGFHVVFGQAWSLTTLQQTGIEPAREDVPLTIDAQYVPGFTWKRTPQVRVSQEIMRRMLWLGASLENPQATVFIGPNGAGQPNGTIVTTNTPGASQLDPAATYSSNVAPDVVLKAVLDPGWGHYEIYGLGRVFASRVSVVGSGHTRSSPAGGIGGGFILPVGGPWLQVHGSVLAGAGIGSYGSAQLPDATIGERGEPVPVPEIQALGGFVGHPARSFDVYAYIGVEQQSARAFAIGGQGFGLGSPLYDNRGCDVEASPLPCAPANTSRVVQATGGLWWRWIEGRYGSMALGAQYAWTHRSVFAGIGGAPSANLHIAMLSLRAYPFQD